MSKKKWKCVLEPWTLDDSTMIPALVGPNGDRAGGPKSVALVRRIARLLNADDAAKARKPKAKKKKGGRRGEGKK